MKNLLPIVLMLVLFGCDSQNECESNGVGDSSSRLPEGDAAQADAATPSDAALNEDASSDAALSIDASTDATSADDAAVTPGRMEKVVDFSGASLNMYRYIPGNAPSNAPIVVAMHGCTQDAATYANTGWNDLADRYGFYVVYPENPSLVQNKCFQWFQASDITRGQGQAAAIAAMVERMKSDFSIDSGRVFVTGLSAGAAMTAIMLATYPDVFSAGAIIAGLPYACATSTVQGFSCMNPGKDQSPAQWGQLIRDAVADHSAGYPRVSIWHGTNDLTVKPMNAIELVEQWTNAHGHSTSTAAAIDDSNPQATRYTYGAGEVEYWKVDGLGHAVPLDETCGSVAPYIERAGVFSTNEIARFFGLN